MSIQVLIVDDHRIFREGLRALLERQPDIEVVAEAADGREAVEMTRELSPDVVIMDIRMPILSGIEATRQIIAVRPRTKVIALSMHSDMQFVLEMLRAGASGYLLKDCCQHDVAHAVRTVDADITFLSAEIAHAATAEQAPHQGASKHSLHPVLSTREREVLQLLAEGKSTREIAIHFQISVKTIETYRWRIRNKLKIRSLAELTKYALREGLASLDS